MCRGGPPGTFGGEVAVSVPHPARGVRLRAVPSVGDPEPGPDLERLSPALAEEIVEAFGYGAA